MSMDDNDGQMIFGDLGGLKLPDICLTGEEKPRKNLTQETCPNRGSNLGPLRNKHACYHLLHSGGLEFSCWQLHTMTDDVGYCIPFKIVLVTKWLLLEQVSNLILTCPPAELRFIHALRLLRTNIRVYQFDNVK